MRAGKIAQKVHFFVIFEIRVHRSFYHLLVCKQIPFRANKSTFLGGRAPSSPPLSDGIRQGCRGPTRLVGFWWLEQITARQYQCPFFLRRPSWSSCCCGAVTFVDVAYVGWVPEPLHCLGLQASMLSYNRCFIFYTYSEKSEGIRLESSLCSLIESEK